MTSDLDLLFHCGEEFTKRGFPHVHCIVHSLSPATRSYIVEFTSTGNIKNLSEGILLKSYVKSGPQSCKDAIEKMGGDYSRDHFIDEDGQLCSP